MHRKLAEKSSCRTDLAALGALRAAAPAPVAGVAAALPPAAPHSKQLHGSSERFRQHAETFATKHSSGGRRANFCGISRLKIGLELMHTSQCQATQHNAGNLALVWTQKTTS